MRKKRLFVLAILGVVSVISVVTLFAVRGDSASHGSGESTRDGAALPPLAAAPAGTQFTTESRAGGVAGSPSLDSSTSGGKAATKQAAGGTTSSDGGGVSLPGLADRKVILNAALSLNVDDVAGAFDTASGFARSSGGYVERSSFVAVGGASQKAATLTIRVPAERYDQLLSQLRTIPGAKVASESSKSAEVTDQYTDLQSRLRNLQRTEQSYLKLMEQAKTVQEILTLNDRLDSVRGQIEQIQGRINVLDHMTDLATVDVTLSPIVPGKSEPTSGPKPIGEAFADAWEWSLDALRYGAAGGAVAVVAAGWLVVPVLLAGLGLRRARRRPVEPPAPVASA